MQKNEESSDDFKRNSHQNEIKKSIKLDQSFLNGIHSQARLYEVASKTLSNMTEMNPKLLDVGIYAKRLTESVNPKLFEVSACAERLTATIDPRVLKLNSFADQLTGMISPEMIQIGKFMQDYNPIVESALKQLTNSIQTSIPKMTLNLDKLASIIQFSIPSSYLDSIQKSLNIQRRMTENFEKQQLKFVETAKKTSPRLSRLSTILCKNGWGISPSIGWKRLNQIVDSDLTVDTVMEHLYEANNYEYLISDLESLSNGLPNELKEIPKLVGQTFIDKQSSFKLMFPYLFSILNYLFVRGTGNEFTNGKNNGMITSYKGVRREEKRLHDIIQSSDSPDIYNIIVSRLLKVIENLFSNIPNMNQPFDKNPYGRHTIDHGRYDVRKLTEVDFYKLVSVCASFEMVSDLTKFKKFYS